MKRYPSRLEGPETAPARCIGLLEKASEPTGVVLDLGCGRGPLAEPVKERGFEYVGVDIDRDALAEVAGRGFETHYLDLGAEEADLTTGLREILGARRASAVITADLLEHLVAPEKLLRAARELGEDVSLIVSIPNITHLNVGAKLLLGRWDPTERGLLDDTHLRYFSENVLGRLLGATGWRQVDVADAEDPDSFDQRFPEDSPTLRPGTPARDLLRRLRSAAEPHASTYQFVRRFVPGDAPSQEGFRWALDPEADRDRPFASVLLRAANGESAPPHRLLADLEAQSAKGFETLEVAAGPEGWNRGIESAAGRYLLFLGAECRVAPGWIESFEDVPEPLGGRILKAGAVAIPSSRLADDRAEALVASGKPIEVNSLDLLAPEPPGPTVLPAYAVPADAVRAAGLRVEPHWGDASLTVFLSRVAELTGVLPLGATTVAVSDAARGDDDALDSVAESLDAAPLILPAGSATRILVMRRALRRSLRWRARRRLRQLKRRLQPSGESEPGESRGPSE